MTSTTEWIRSRLLDLKTRPDTAAYVVGVMAGSDLTELLHIGSIVLAFRDAGGSFDSHRRLADGVLAAEIAFHGWLSEPVLCVQLAQRSYGTCDRLLGGAWACYAELAARLPEIIDASRDAWVSCRTRTPREP